MSPLAEALRIQIPIRPIRGQMAALRCAMLLSHTVYCHDGYLVPRADGRLLIGATQEDVGFNCVPTTEGIQKLLAFATRMIPELAHAQFESAWAGLRPASADDLPVLGLAPGWRNVFVAAGHFRNGILLAPITADLISRLIAEGTDDPQLAPFRPDRFLHAPLLVGT